MAGRGCGVKAHPRLIGYLQRAVNHEFCACQQYTLQAVQADCWNMQTLAQELREGVREELRHAEIFIQQLLVLGVSPHAAPPHAPAIGRSHEEMLRLGLATEVEAIRLYREACRFCERSGDAIHHAVFARILQDEEHHQQELARQLEALGGRRA